MFNRFDRYVARNVVAATLITEIILVALYFGIIFINKLGGIQGNYGVGASFIYQCLRIPWRIYQFAPLSVLLGALIGLGNMAASNELTAMRAAGCSIARLTFSAIKPLFVISLLVMAMGQWVIPSSEQAAQDYRAEKQQQGQDVDSTDNGLWQLDHGNAYHFNAIRSNGTLLGIVRYEFDGTKLVEADTAQSGTYDYQQHQWILHNVQRSNFNDNSVVPSHTDAMTWQTDLTPTLLSRMLIDPQTQSISSLWDLAHYQRDQHTISSTTSLYMWQKILQPLSFISLMLMAASFVFGPLRSKSASTRIFIGVVIGLCIHYLQQIMAPLSLLYGIPPIMAVLLPIVLCTLLGLYLFSKNK